MTTIRQRLTRRLLLTGLVLVALAGAGVYYCARTALLGQFDTALLARAQTLTTVTSVKGDKVEIEFSDELVHGYEKGGGDFFEFWRAGGAVVERSRSLGAADLVPRPEPADRPQFLDLVLPGGRAGRAVSLTFRPQDAEDDKKSAGTDLVLVVAAARDDLDRTLATLLLVLAGGGGLLLAGTALAVPRALSEELAPLQLLADQAARIDAGSLGARFPVAGLPGELAPITARLNELLARLETSFERERRFSSDVAHEFRTPVAELRCLAELALKLPEERAANTDAEVLAVALHLESVLSQLLALARGEAGAAALQPERVRLERLLEEIVVKFQRAAAARQIQLRWHAEAGAETVTDAGLLRSILRNLVDNAVEYAPAGATVAVEARVVGGRLTVRVVNPVDNLEAADLPLLFDRFWRKDPARSSGSNHSGLGLPLARLFARALGGELSATLVRPAELELTLVVTATNPAGGPSQANRPAG